MARPACGAGDGGRTGYGAVAGVSAAADGIRPAPGSTASAGGNGLMGSMPLSRSVTRSGPMPSARSRLAGSAVHCRAIAPGSAARAESDEQDAIARLDAPVGDGLGERDRDRRGRGVAVAVDVDEDPLHAGSEPTWPGPRGCARWPGAARRGRCRPGDAGLLDGPERRRAEPPDGQLERLAALHAHVVLSAATVGLVGRAGPPRRPGSRSSTWRPSRWSARCPSCRPAHPRRTGRPPRRRRRTGCRCPDRSSRCSGSSSPSR